MNRTLFQVWPAVLLIAILVLLAPGIGYANAALGLCVIAGVVLAWRERSGLRIHAGVRLAVALFLCYWLAALISAFDSVAPGKSWSTVGGLLRFLPFALFACLGLREARIWPRVTFAIGAVVALWLFDAWVQAFTGYGIAGASDKDRLSVIQYIKYELAVDKSDPNAPYAYFVEEPAGGQRDGLRRPSRPDERHGPRPSGDQVGHQVGGLCRSRAPNRRAVLAGELGERRLPQREQRLAPGRSVVGHRGHVHAGQP